MAPSHEPPTPRITRSTPRRTLLRGAAWTAPALTVAHAVPAFAASQCEDEEFTLELPNGGLGDVDGEAEDFIVPEGVEEIEFEVLGGAGGGRSATLIGGAGTLVRGTLQVTPLETLHLIVGQGGAGYPSAELGGVADSGGKGYGNGGNSVIPRRPGSTAVAGAYFAGASGGAGSAILRGTSPLVIAGGGGGAGASLLEPTGANYTYVQHPVGGPGDTGGTYGELSITVPSRSIRAPGGGGASSNTPGSGGTQPDNPAPNTWEHRVRSTGNAGSFSSTGSAGGTGGYATTQEGTSAASYSWGVAGGAGGGGYAGGGGGSAIAAYFGIVSSSYRAICVGGAGGGGSSFTLSSVVTAPHTEVGDNANAAANIRRPGRIVLRWSECN